MVHLGRIQGVDGLRTGESIGKGFLKARLGGAEGTESPTVSGAKLARGRQDKQDAGVFFGGRGTWMENNRSRSRRFLLHANHVDETRLHDSFFRMQKGDFRQSESSANLGFSARGRETWRPLPQGHSAAMGARILLRTRTALYRSRSGA